MTAIAAALGKDGEGENGQESLHAGKYPNACESFCLDLGRKEEAVFECAQSEFRSVILLLAESLRFGGGIWSRI